LFTQYAQPELRDTSGELVAVVADYEVNDARRLAACWNACEGISTENLESNLPVKELATRYNAVLTQRDKLLQALKNTRAALFYQIEGKHGPKVASEYPEIVEAKAAIAMAEAGAGSRPADPLIQHLPSEDTEGGAI
jgi:hypothetical protein